MITTTNREYFYQPDYILVFSKRLNSFRPLRNYTTTSEQKYTSNTSLFNTE